MPVEAPEGTAAVPDPTSVETVTCNVGFPRESKISIASTCLIVAPICSPQ